MKVLQSFFLLIISFLFFSFQGCQNSKPEPKTKPNPELLTGNTKYTSSIIVGEPNSSEPNQIGRRDSENYRKSIKNFKRRK